MLHTEFGMLNIRLYVDYILMLTDRNIMITWIKHELKDGYETIFIDTSQSFTNLRMVVSKNKNCLIDMHMAGYIEKLLVYWGK